MFSLLKKIFGSRNDRLLKQLRRQVAQINAFEPQVQALSDEQLRGKTEDFRNRLRPILFLPNDPRDRPPAIYINESRKVRRWRA